MSDVADLLARAGRDDEAFRELRQRFERLVWASTASYRLDRHTREDIAQIVWLRLLQRLDTIREPERLAGWLATTARREAQRTSMARARVVATDRQDEQPSGTAELDVALIRDERARAVALGLLELDARCRDLLRLIYYSDPTPSYEVVVQLIDGLNEVGSVGPTVQRCRDKLARTKAVTGISETPSRSV